MSRYRRTDRTPKTLERKVRDLDDHVWLLRSNLHGLRDDPAHLKAIAGELRALVCRSAGTEGLLWRLVDEVNVSDELDLIAFQSVKRDHPLARGLSFGMFPLARPDDAPPGAPVDRISLRQLFRECEAIYLQSVQDKLLTHEVLIKAVSQQIGSAHEDEGADFDIVRLSKINIGGTPPYARILAFDAELVLQVAERVLDTAEQRGLFTRRIRRSREGATGGEMTIVTRLACRDQILGKLNVLSMKSNIAETEIQLFVRPQTIVVEIEKRGKPVGQLLMNHPEGWSSEQDTLVAFSYSSAERKARMIANQQASDPVECGLGWIDAREFRPHVPDSQASDILRPLNVGLYSRLLSPRECGELLSLSPDLKELRLAESPKSGFPE